jgi:predicted esterase
MLTRRLARAVCLALCFCVTTLRSQAVAQDAPPPPGAVSRELLGWWYLEVDRAWEAVRWNADAPQVQDVNKRFDDISLLFFKLDWSGAIRQLVVLRDELVGASDKVEPAALAMNVEPRTWNGDAAGHPTARVSFLGTAPASWKASVSLNVTSEGKALVPAAVKDLELSSNPEHNSLDLSTWIDWAALAKVLPTDSPSQIQFSLEIGGRVYAADRLIVSRPSLAARNAAWQTQLRDVKLESTELEHAGEMLNSRVGLFTDDPSRNRSCEFLADYPQMAASIEGELAAIKGGRSPYPLAGTWWASVKSGKGSVACWFSAPSPIPSKPAPLLVLFHGAGGDESMFVKGYGQGALVTKALQRGMIVVSVNTTTVMSSGSAFRAVLRRVDEMYPIDADRIYLAGHSMGAMAVAGLAQKEAAILAGVVCLAGGQFDPALPCAPTLVIAGGIDPIIPASRLKPNAQAAKDAGLDVSYRERELNGHTFLVNDFHDMALDFLSAQSLSRRPHPAGRPASK